MGKDIALQSTRSLNSLRDVSSEQSTGGLECQSSMNESVLENTFENSDDPEKDIETGSTPQVFDSRGDPEKRPAVFKSTAHEIIVIALMTMAPVLSSTCNGALTIALPAIGRHFNVAGGTLSWTMSASSLATGAFLLVMGQLADTLGRRKLLILSYVWYCVTSLAAGLVPQFTKGSNDGGSRVSLQGEYIGFVVLRAMQGLAGAAAVTSAVGILGAAYMPGRRRNYAMATFSAGGPLGFVVGIVSGGICTEIISWNSVLYFYAIIYAAVSVVAYFYIPITAADPPFTMQFVKQQAKKIDYGGAFLACSGLTLFVFALAQWEAAPHGWATPYIGTCLGLGLALVVAFCFYEALVPQRPIMPMYIWRAKGFALCMAIIACGWIAFNGVLSFYATLYFQEIQDASPILTTAYFVPQCIAGIFVNILAGAVLHRISGRVLLVVAMAGFTVSAILWSLCNIHTLYWALPFPALILVVLGADLAYNVCNLHALSVVDSTLQSTAAGVFNTCLQLATAVGLALASAVVDAVAPRHSLDTHISKTLAMKGYRAGFCLAIGVCGLGLIMSFFLRIGTQGGKQRSK